MSKRGPAANDFSLTELAIECITKRYIDEAQFAISILQLNDDIIAVQNALCEYPHPKLRHTLAQTQWRLCMQRQEVLQTTPTPLLPTRPAPAPPLRTISRTITPAYNSVKAKKPEDQIPTNKNQNSLDSNRFDL